MKSIRKFIVFSLSTIYYSLYTLIFPKSALAQSAWTGRCVDGDVATIQGFECLFANIMQVVVTFAGLGFFIMFIYAGFQYLTSENDDKKLASVNSIFTMAITGIIGVIASYLILNFIKTFTGANVTQFNIPGP